MTNKQIHRVCGYNWPTGIGVPYLKRQSICCGSVAQDSVVILVSMVDNVGIVRTYGMCMDVMDVLCLFCFGGYIYPAVQVLGLWLAISYLRNLGIEPLSQQQFGCDMALPNMQSQAGWSPRSPAISKLIGICL